MLDIDNNKAEILRIQADIDDAVAKQKIISTQLTAIASDLREKGINVDSSVSQEQLAGQIDKQKEQMQQLTNDLLSKKGFNQTLVDNKTALEQLQKKLNEMNKLKEEVGELSNQLEAGVKERSQLADQIEQVNSQLDAMLDDILAVVKGDSVVSEFVNAIKRDKAGDINELAALVKKYIEGLQQGLERRRDLLAKLKEFDKDLQAKKDSLQEVQELINANKAALKDVFSEEEIA